jgi:hypothetical protein
MEDHSGIDLMLAEDVGKPLGIEAHIEQRELAYMHVRIDSHRLTSAGREAASSADSSTDPG